MEQSSNILTDQYDKNKLNFKELNKDLCKNSMFEPYSNVDIEIKKQSYSAKSKKSKHKHNDNRINNSEKMKKNDFK